MDETLSTSLSSLLKTFQNVKAQYDVAYEEVHNQDLLQQDLLHKLEFGTLDAPAISKLAKRLKECRETRRYYKDLVDCLYPILQFLEDPSNKRAVNNMQKLLGDIRKQETNHKNRRYCPRVMSEEEYHA